MTTRSLVRQFLLTGISPSCHIVRSISVSAILNHNPNLKKKSKSLVDPAKLERQRKKMEAKLLKKEIKPPVDHDSMPDPDWFSAHRQREIAKVSSEELEQRILLEKEWARHLMKQHVTDLKMLKEKVQSRQAALRELKKESLFLYEEALKVDKKIYPLNLKGPMDTPSMEDYGAPDFVDEKR